MHKKMPATTWLAWVHVFNYFTCLLDRGASYDELYSIQPVKNKKELINLLFNDLRVDTDLFLLCDLYDYVFYLSRNTEFKRKVA